MTQSPEHAQREIIWLRLLWMVVFFLIWHLAEVLLGLVVVLQVGYQLFTRAPNVALQEFGGSLAQYLAQIARFGTFNSEDKPWPFNDWPEAQVSTDAAASVEKPATAQSDTGSKS